VVVFRLGGEEAARSPSIAASEWTCDRELARGVDYEWQVEASRGGERVTLPQPPDTPPRFRVLDAAAARRLSQLARQDPADRVRIGVESARAGAVEAARAELQATLEKDPSREDIRKLLATLPR
jgi:hypothetical protein